MGLRFGYGTNGFSRHRLSDVLNILADLGYDGVALTLDHNHLDPYADDLARQVARVGAQLARLGLTVTVETAGALLPRPLAQAPADADERRTGTPGRPAAARRSRRRRTRFFPPSRWCSGPAPDDVRGRRGLASAWPRASGRRWRQRRRTVGAGLRTPAAHVHRHRREVSNCANSSADTSCWVSAWTSNLRPLRGGAVTARLRRPGRAAPA